MEAVHLHGAVYSSDRRLIIERAGWYSGAMLGNTGVDYFDVIKYIVGGILYATPDRSSLVQLPHDDAK